MMCDKQLKSLTRPDDNATFKQRPGELILHGSRKASWYTPRTSTRSFVILAFLFKPVFHAHPRKILYIYTTHIFQSITYILMKRKRKKRIL